jgi:formyl-CoA transferase
MAARARADRVVVDLSTGIDGPFCTKLLAESGCQVTKVEHPRGDPARRIRPLDVTRGPGPLSSTFLYLNRMKSNLVIDYETAAGAAEVRRLIEEADIVVENHAPGYLAEFGLGYGDARELNESLVFTSITPFGQEGPYAQFRGPDLVRQAVSGFSFQGGLPGEAPLRAGADLSYYVTGVAAAAATLIAMLGRHRTGIGQHVDVSSVEVMTTCGGQEVSKFSYEAASKTFKRDGHVRLPAMILPCADGYIGVNVVNQRQWLALCALVGMEDLLADERFALIADVRELTDQEPALTRISEFVRHRPAEVLMVEGQAAGVALIEVPSVARMLTWPQHLARGFFRESFDEAVGKFLEPDVPFRSMERGSRDAAAAGDAHPTSS